LFQQDPSEFDRTSRELLVRYQDIYVALLEEQRNALLELNRKEEYDEDLIRKYLSLIDLEETKLRELTWIRPT
jgi:hypothetical protein